MLNTKTMKNLIKFTLPLLLTMLIVTSCSEANRRVNEKLDEITNKASQLDSIVNSEADKIMKLDSLLLKENDRLQKLDSLVNNASSKVDTIIKTFRNKK
jgi:ABC-type transport system involved in Fe-S cluster assembly fused permease/ATPase subunit